MDSVKFTKREQWVIDELIKGRSNQEIADILFICRKSVIFHLGNIYRKFEVKTRSQFLCKYFTLRLEALQSSLISEQSLKLESDGLSVGVGKR